MFNTTSLVSIGVGGWIFEYDAMWGRTSGIGGGGGVGQSPPPPLDGQRLPEE